MPIRCRSSPRSVSSKRISVDGSLASTTVLENAMPSPTDHFGSAVIHALRDNVLYSLNALLAGDASFGASPEAIVAVAKLSDVDRAALRATLTGVIDSSIEKFLYALDDAANTQGGLAITYGGKRLTTGDYEFGERFASWRGQTAHHDATGTPNDRALT